MIHLVILTGGRYSLILASIPRRSVIDTDAIIKYRHHRRPPRRYVATLGFWLSIRLGLRFLLTSPEVFLLTTFYLLYDSEDYQPIPIMPADIG